MPPEEPDPKSDKKKKSEVAQQDVFMREVDDALRKDEMQSFFSRYGVPLALLLVLGLGGFAGYLWWQDSLAQVAEKRGEDYVIALDHLDANRFGEADGKLSLLANEEGIASATAAKLLRAGIAMEQKRTKDAIKLYAEVAGDAAAPQPYRDMATVREVAANFDAMKPEDVIVRLKPLAVPGNPWFGVAGEMVGIAYLKQDKKDLAGPIFAKIAEDKDMPETLRERARQFAVSLGVDTLDDVIEDEAEKLAKDAEESADDADEDGGAPAT